VDGLDGVPGAPLRPIAVSIRFQIDFEDRLDHQLHGSLHHPVPERRHSHIELHFDPVSLWARLRSPIRFTRFAVTGLLF